MVISEKDLKTNRNQNFRNESLKQNEKLRMHIQPETFRYGYIQNIQWHENFGKKILDFGKNEESPMDSIC